MPPAFKPRGGPVQAAPPPAPTPVAPPAFSHPMPPIEIVGLQGVSPTMIASLPDMASGADVYLRQFYRGSRIPFRRYLPIRSQ